MHFVYVDPNRKLLHQILAGSLDRAAGNALLADVDRALAQLPPGFEILSDLRDLREVNEDAEECVRELMQRCGKHGPSLLVRVVRDPTANFGFTIMSYFHYPRETRVVTCFNLEEAAALLTPWPAPATPG